VPGGLVVGEVGSFDGGLEAVDDDELCAELHGLDIDIVGLVFVGFVLGLVEEAIGVVEAGDAAAVADVERVFRGEAGVKGNSLVGGFFVGAPYDRSGF